VSCECKKHECKKTNEKKFGCTKIFGIQIKSPEKLNLLEESKILNCFVILFHVFIFSYFFTFFITLLHFLVTTSESKYQVESGLFLDVVVRQSSTVLELFSSEDESLLIGRDAFFVLNFRFHVFNGVGRLDL
jgi:hypothetical protein